MKVRIDKDYNLKELLNIQKIVDSLTDKEYAPLVEFWDNLVIDEEKRVYVTPGFTPVEPAGPAVPFDKYKITC